METLHPDFEQLKKEGTEPEHVILYKLLSIFGPLPPELITHVNDEYWGELLMALSQVVADEDPSDHFEQWEENVSPNLDPETKRVISRMMKLDPKKRATMDQILEDPWWKCVEDCEWHCWTANERSDGTVSKAYIATISTLIDNHRTKLGKTTSVSQCAADQPDDLTLPPHHAWTLI